MSEAETCYLEFLLFHLFFYYFLYSSNILCYCNANNSRYRSQHFTPFCTISSLYILTGARHTQNVSLYYVTKLACFDQFRLAELG